MSVYLSQHIFILYFGFITTVIVFSSDVFFFL